MLQRRTNWLGLAALALAAVLAGSASAQLLPRRGSRPAPVETEPAPANVLRVRLLLPADAEVWVNGVKTVQRGSVRTFVSPELEADQKYAYEFRARWRAGGKDVERTRKISFKAGDRLTVDFMKDATGPVRPAPGKALYERLGAEAGIRAVVDDLVARAAADARVNFTRKGTGKEWKPTPQNMATLKARLVEMIGAATGGPQKYTGRGMKEVHKGMQISDKQFAALADDLRASLDKLKVPLKAQDELLAIVAATGKDIVEPVAPMRKTLYDRLGGAAGVKAIADDFVARALADPKANFTHKGTPKEWKPTPENVAMRKMDMARIIGSVSGGGQKYSSKAMKEMHKGMRITGAEFDALLADLKASLDKVKAPAKERDDLLAIMAGMKKDIVEQVAPTAKTLYERLGGEARVKAIVDDFVTRALADPKANFVRKGTPREWKPTPENVAALKTHMAAIIETSTGGPRKYTGKTMKETHKGMKITAAEFDALTADLKASLDKAKVPAAEQAELLKIVASTKNDVVGQ